ncbi:MAG TPA: hypothetical protein VEU53_07215 [Stellaceae bacterium]|nr:hypothetical protein [Stellaceae bacterium]
MSITRSPGAGISGAGAGSLALERLGVPLLPPACAMLSVALPLVLIEARAPKAQKS